MSFSLRYSARGGGSSIDGCEGGVAASMKGGLSGLTVRRSGVKSKEASGQMERTRTDCAGPIADVWETISMNAWAWRV